MTPTLERDGWLDGRPFSAVPPRGEADKFVCLACRGETPPDRDQFIAHDCDELRQSAAEADVDATQAAIDLADAEGVDITEIEGTGTDGRVIQPDVEGAIEERE